MSTQNFKTPSNYSIQYNNIQEVNVKRPTIKNLSRELYASVITAMVNLVKLLFLASLFSLIGNVPSPPL